MVGRVLVLGASGRIGRMLRHHGLPGVTACWQFRDRVDQPGAVIFDPAAEDRFSDRLDAVLCLSGVVSGDPAALAVNSTLALAALEIGAGCGAKRVFLASSAAVYGGAALPLSEDAPRNPQNAYGHAKAMMEDAAQARAAQLGLPLTILRIGNVAGADALLGQQAQAAITLDRFADGQGPRRSYIGPQDLSAVMAALLRLGAAGGDLPLILNLALPGAVDMADLLRAAGRDFAWRDAPATALSTVVLDVARLARYVPLPTAPATHTPATHLIAARIVGDWQRYSEATS